MRFQEFRARNFRNFGSMSASFPDGAQFIRGGNGQGKTNLLEALGLVTSLRSFRAADVSSMIHWEARPRQATLVYELNHEQLGDTMLEIQLRPGSKQVLLDGNPVRRLGEILGLFPTIPFSSQDIQLLRGSPSVRRRLLDMMFVLMDPAYYESLSCYHQALKARNALLKQRAGPSQRRVFEDMLVNEGWSIVTLRRKLLGIFQPHFQTAYAGISGGKEEPRLDYLASLDAPDRESYEAAFLAAEGRDLETAATNRGPHRDDLEIRLQDHPAREFASEGQQRGLVLSLRMGLVDWYHRRGGTPPVILADDIVGELDSGRRRGFWQMLGSGCQIIATGTQFPEEDTFHDWVHWHMEGGVLGLGGKGVEK